MTLDHSGSQKFEQSAGHQYLLDLCVCFPLVGLVSVLIVCNLCIQHFVA